MVDLVLLLAPFALLGGRSGRGKGERTSRGAIGPVVAGTWYPASRDALAREVDGLLERAAASAERGGGGGERVLALVEPHAGYAYSGETAARGFVLLRGERLERVVLLGPSHHARFRGAAVTTAEALRTPLGDVPLDREAIALLASCPGFSRDDEAFDREHGLEAELPFLQRALAPGWSALPILIGSGTRGRDAEQIAEGLLSLPEAATLVVVSSDFTHFGAGFGYEPFHRDVEERIRELDLGALSFLERLDADGLERYLDRTGATVCGRDAIGILLRLLPEDTRATVLAYDTSGRITGDFHHSVSYATVAFRRLGGWPASKAPLAASGALSERERGTLLDLARAAVREAVLHDGSLARAREVADLTPALLENRGSFVTLCERGGRPGEPGRLRGCIGTVFADSPLHEDVVRNAGQAALHDPRFAPVAPAELSRLELSVSALTAPRAVRGPEAIVVGRHGVLLEKGPHRAVFLPQVATEQGWSVEQLLDHLAVKAGLPRDGARSGASFSVFEAEVFGCGPIEGRDDGGG